MIALIILGGLVLMVAGFLISALVMAVARWRRRSARVGWLWGMLSPLAAITGVYIYLLLTPGAVFGIIVYMWLGSVVSLFPGCAAGSWIANALFDRFDKRSSEVVSATFD